MLYLTVVLFALAALAGLFILKNWLTSAATSRTVVFTHGIFAAVALLLLFMQVLRQPSQFLKNSIILFAVAAVGGFYMFFRDLKGKFSPVWLALIHGLLAVAGFVFLLLTIF